MFLYPALVAGFVFVGVPLLVHLINLLRHQRRQWAAMDFLLASYRKQKKWIRLRQMLLLLSRLAAAALLIAMLAGWTGSGGILSLPGGATTHHVVLLDDSYSMGEIIEGQTAYSRALRSVDDLARRLASDDGNHQLTVLRASRAMLAIRAGGDSADAAADLVVQTVAGDGQLVSRIMGTDVSPIKTDLSVATELAAGLIESTPADATSLYIASDFRNTDWASPDRVTTSLRTLSSDVKIRLIDCANPSLGSNNLAVTELEPRPDVWVAGVPVVMRAKVRNYGQNAVKNVPLAVRVIRYGDEVDRVDETRDVSGIVQTLPAPIIESLAPGAEITKTFQVYLTAPGTHAVEVSLPEDSLRADNRRVCTLPLTDVEKVLIIDGGLDGKGAFHIASVLDPGGQVRIGAVPDVRPPAFLRSITAETLATYRAVYLVDLDQVGSNASDALTEYVRRGGGLAMFLGSSIDRSNYNDILLGEDRRLLPAPLGQVSPLAPDRDGGPDIVLGDTDLPLIAPLAVVGDSAFNLVGLRESWQFDEDKESIAESSIAAGYEVALRRRDGQPLVTVHDFGAGRVLTSLTGLSGDETNWPGDPTFVVFLLQSNAHLWSAAAPSVGRKVDDVIDVPRFNAGSELDANATIEMNYYPTSAEPPRLSLDWQASVKDGDDASEIDPAIRLLDADATVDDWMRPGIAEWSLLQADGATRVVPAASNIRMGEGNLKRMSSAEVIQALQPVEVSYLSSSAWSLENNRTASSRVALILLGILGLVLAAEQTLASWASYHVRPRTRSSSGSPGGSSGLAGKPARTTTAAGGSTQ